MLQKNVQKIDQELKLEMKQNFENKIDGKQTAPKEASKIKKTDFKKFQISNLIEILFYLIALSDTVLK